MKSGQNLKFEKDYFQTGLSDASRRNTRDILTAFLGNELINKKARNISRKSKTKRKK